MTPDDPRHGTKAGYDAHLRDREPTCPDCRLSAARYEKRRQIDIMAGRHRTAPPLGTARRLQALVALGWTFRQLGERLGASHDGATKLAHKTTGTVRTSTAVRVATVYEQLSMTHPPETTGAQQRLASYARTTARKNGWLPPLAWDDIDHDPAPLSGAYTPRHSHDHTTADEYDQAVVIRVLNGDFHLPSTVAERRAVVARWTGSLADLERLTGWKVDRYTTARTDTREDAA